MRPLVSLSLAAFTAFGCAAEPADHEHLEGPIEGLSHEQTRAFVLGDQAFERFFTPAEGLGPRFNEASCQSCHAGDGAGHPKTIFLRFGRLDENGFDPLLAFGGPQLQDRAIVGYEPESLPEQANVTTGLIGNPVTGLGLLEAVDDATILALADPDDEDGDGISGRPQWIAATDQTQRIAARDLAAMPSNTRLQLHDGHYLGRFGRKASAISLLHQTVTALSQDMGLTTEFAPDQLVSPGDSGFPVGDGPRIEIGANTLNALTFYLKTLRPPVRRNADHPTVLRGEKVFEDIGCTSCHVPTLKTGTSSIAALNHVEFHPYTDLLLHDMGDALNDGYTEGIAAPSEWRTSPLWGLGLRADAQGGEMFFLHDGRATSIEETIEYHGGEGATSRANYRQLEATDRQALEAFLMSL